MMRSFYNVERIRAGKWLGVRFRIAGFSGSCTDLSVFILILLGDGLFGGIHETDCKSCEDRRFHSFSFFGEK